MRNYYRESLTESQSDAVDELEVFLGSEESCFLLTGYAGTGKTYILSQLSDYLNDSGKTYYFLTPTGRAARVIRKRTQKAAYTIHSRIYEVKNNNVTSEDTDYDDLKVIFNLRNNLDPTDTIYIIDESSMISDKYSDNERLQFGSGKLLSDLIAYANVTNMQRKIIFVGDEAQLTPVNSNFSPALSSKYLQEQYQLSCCGKQLTDVYRQDGKSGILSQATKVRNQMRNNSFSEVPLSGNGSDILHLDVEEALSHYSQKWLQSIFIASSNALVHQYNKTIRENLGISSLWQGERLLVTKNCMLNGIPLFNGDFIYIESVGQLKERTLMLKEKTETLPITLSFRELDVKMELNGEYFISKCYILENLLYATERELSLREHRALLVDFRMRHPQLKSGSEAFKQALLNDSFFNALHVKFGYAMTCHKSQGGEWDEVFVDLAHYSSVHCEEYFRWCYTAMTRAKEKLYVCNIPNSRLVNKEEDSEGAFAGVTRVLENRGLAFGYRLKQPVFNDYQVQYPFEFQHARLRVIFSYNAHLVITHCNITDYPSEEVRNNLEKICKDIQGKSARDFDDQPLTKAEDRQFASIDVLMTDLREKLMEIEVKIKTIHFSEYQIKYTFTAPKGESLLYFYYKKDNFLSKVSIQSGDEELARAILKHLDIPAGVVS